MPDIFVAEEKESLSQSHTGSVKFFTPGVKTKQGLGARYETVAERLVKERRIGGLRSFNIMPGRVRFETQEVREK